MILSNLFSIIEERKAHPHPDSYTNKLMAAGEDTILRKIGEEFVEVFLAAKGEGDQRLIEETADLLYHTLVLLSFRDLSLHQVEAELGRRHQEKTAP